MTIRPMLAADIDAAREVTSRALGALDERLGEPVAQETDVTVVRGRRRIAHLQATDPDSCWVAEVDSAVAGCAVALVRDGMWFLSLLMVDPPHQGSGLGRRLLDAALATATDRSWILSTVDPGAVRRYRRAGFDLLPAYAAKGTAHRASLPAAAGVREGGLDDDRELVDDVLRRVRGAATGDGDLAVPRDNGFRLLVVDDRAGRGFALVRPTGPAWVGGTTVDAARRVLVASIAEAAGSVEVDWLTAEQQWAIDVCLDARLSLYGGPSVCVRGRPGRLTPYLPNGAFG